MPTQRTQPNAAATKGGRRRPRVSVEATRRRIRALLGEGAVRNEIIEKLCTEQGIAERTARTHIADVLDDLSRGWDEERPFFRVKLAQRLRALSVAAQKRGAFSASVRAEQLFGEIHGILGPRGEAVPAAPRSSWADEPMTLADAEARVHAAQQAIDSAKAAQARANGGHVDLPAFEMIDDDSAPL